MNIGLTGLNKINIFADVQTGKNAFGAAGGGICIYFTPAIDILTGPVFFFDGGATPHIFDNKKDWLWSIQLDIDIDFHKAPPPPAVPASAEPSKA